MRRAATRWLLLATAALAGCHCAPPPAPTLSATQAAAELPRLARRVATVGGARSPAQLQQQREALAQLAPVLQRSEDRDLARLLLAHLHAAAQQHSPTAEADPVQRYRIALAGRGVTSDDLPGLYRLALQRLGTQRTRLLSLAGVEASRDLRALAQSWSTQAASSAAEQRARGAVPRDCSQAVTLPCPDDSWRWLAGPLANAAPDELLQLTAGPADAMTVTVRAGEGPLPRLAVEAVVAREVWPGRWAAAALRRRSGLLEDWQRELLSAVQVEGWPLAAARLADRWHPEAAPAQQLGQLLLDSLACVRAAADLGLHALGHSEAQVRQLYLGHTVLDKSAIHADLERLRRRPGVAVAALVGAGIYELALAQAERAPPADQLAALAGLLGAGPLDEAALRARARGLAPRREDAGPGAVTRTSSSSPAE